MTIQQRLQLIKDYDEGRGPRNMVLAKKYGVTNTTIRKILIHEGVYKPQRRLGIEKPLGYTPEINQLLSENKRLKETLDQIANWELPPSGKFWDAEKTDPMSFRAAYGFAEEMKYFRNMANETLEYCSNFRENITDN